MKYLFIEYPKCSTCQKAKKWLNDNNIQYIERHIVEKNPNKQELEEWINKSELPIKRFFNTSGLLYKELKIKDKLINMTTQEQIELLSTNGMLIKRPLLIGGKTILVGFKEKEWKKSFKNKKVDINFTNHKNYDKIAMF